jgi:hypothetical protein
MDNKKNFEGLNLNENLVKGVYLHGFTQPSPIQIKGIESINREFSIQLNSKDFPEIIAFEEDDDNVMLLSKFKNGERLDIFWKTLKKKNRISTLKQIISGLEPIMELLIHDKKNEYGNIHFALIEGIGKIKINQSVENELILKAFQDYKS